MKAIVITVSDSCAKGLREDLSGPCLAERLRQDGWEVTNLLQVPDEPSAIEAALRLCGAHSDLMITTGGTGLSSRDVTPEVVRPLLEKELPGFGELMRLRGLEKTPYAVLSRSLAGTLGQSLVLCLPGSPAGAVESLEAVLPQLRHALGILKGSTEH